MKEMFLNRIYAGGHEPEQKIIDIFVCKLWQKLTQATSGSITSRRCGVAAMFCETRPRVEAERTEKRP